MQILLGNIRETVRGMKYAIMSDVHSNPMALEKALKDARSRGCRKFILLGDITGYGYDAERALAIVRKEFDVVLMGNHDSACVGLEPSWEVMMIPNYDIDRAQREMLTKDDVDWIRALDYTYKTGGAAFTHGDFTQPKSWNYIFSCEEAVRNFFSRTEKLMFCGHTHHAAIWEQNKKGEFKSKSEKRFRTPAVKPETITFTPRNESRYIVNVGSVGYPRNDLCSTYCIWDSVANKVTIRRLAFDFKGYIIEMLKHNVELPRWLAELLMKAKSKSVRCAGKGFRDEC